MPTTVLCFRPPSPRTRRRWHPGSWPARSRLGLGLVVLALLAALGGCQTPEGALAPLLQTDEFGQARQVIAQRLTNDRTDRRYLLDRMSLAVVTLADGYPRLAEPTFETVYNLLRTQGINADKTVASVVINEDLKFWKGEPFEQALAMALYGVEQAALNHWDNTRAAAQSALFNLRFFGADARGRPIGAQTMIQRSRQYDAIHPGSDYFNSGYAVRRSDFVLGYLLNAIANQELGRQQEASDNYAVALQINPALEPLVAELKRGLYNTILVVAYGLGPAKIAYGPDGALARFVPRTPSDLAPLTVATALYSGGVDDQTWPQVTDVNRMGANQMWNSLEDVRQAKSLLGSTMMLGGGAATLYGLEHGDRTLTYAGLGALAAGAFLKAGAHADIRYCEALPQRFYIAPVNITHPDQRVTLQVQGRGGSRLVLTGLMPPQAPHPVQLRYVALPGIPGHQGLNWATTGQVLYTNDVVGDIEPGTPPVPGGGSGGNSGGNSGGSSGGTTAGPYPYILGGRDVRLPTATAMAYYQAHGYLRGMTYLELESLYRQEGLVLSPEEAGPAPGRHVLEGGNLMLCPQGGTAGFARLFGQDHPPYRPRTQAVRAAAASIGLPRP